MYRSKSLKKLLCMIITFSLVLTGSAFSVAADELNESVGILSDESVTEEAIAGLSDESASVPETPDSLTDVTDETVSLIDDVEGDFYDNTESVDDVTFGEEDTEHISESVDSTADPSTADGTEDFSADSTLTDSSLTDSSLTDSSLEDISLTDSSLTDESLAEEMLVGASDNIEEGLYVLQSALTGGVCMGIAGNSCNNQVNVELVTKNGGYGQAFYLRRTSDGYYHLINYHTGKAVHIPGGGKTAGTNVVQYSVRDMNAQKWCIKYVSGSSYVTLQSVYNGLYIDCAAGKYTAGTNLNLNKQLANAKREMWKLVPAYGKVAAEARLTDANISEGYYHINLEGHSTLVSHVASASKDSGASIMVKTLGTSYSQAFQVLPQGSGLYKIKNVRSGKYFATSNGSGGTANIVQKDESSGDASQLWYILTDPNNGHIIIKPSNSKHAVMTTRGIASGKNILNSNFVNNSTQFWEFSKATVYEKDALYTPSEMVCYIAPAVSTGKTYGVKGGAFDNFTNVQLTTQSSSNAVKWRIIPEGDGTYRIQNLKTGKALDIYAGSFAAGSNIDQYTVNGTDAQKWTFRYTGVEDGSVYITSADTNYAADLENGKFTNGTNVFLNSRALKASQRYILKKTSINYKAQWITSKTDKRYYYNSNKEKMLGWHKISNNYYYFYKSTGIMARNTTIQSYTIDSEGISNKSDFVTATGSRTLRGLLTNAVAPAGRVLYIWGGGHGGSDTSKIGILPTWTSFYNSHVSSSYDYNNYRWQYGMGLDCSGFVGWTVYNTIYTEDNVTDIDNTSTYIAADYISRGWCHDDASGYKPGDIVSRSGHVWISMGTCEDGSVLIMHSTPQGVQLSGTEGDSVELAAKYMNQISKSTNWPFAVKQYGSGYLSYVGKATWTVDGSGILTDPEGLQKKSAEEVCKIVFGY